MFIIEVLSFSIIPISRFRGAIVSEIQKCLPEAICCYYYKIYIVYRDFITMLIIDVLNYTIIQNFTTQVTPILFLYFLALPSLHPETF